MLRHGIHAFQDSLKDVPGLLTRTTYAQAPTSEKISKDAANGSADTHDMQNHQHNLSSSPVPASNSVVTEQNYNASALSDRELPLHYAEAKQNFESHPPPFVQSKQGKHFPHTSAILATPSGEYPENPEPVAIAVRSWNDDEKYWTLDINGERLIVKNFAGGPRGGAIFRSWLGVERTFSQKPVAFSVKPSDLLYGEGVPSRKRRAKDVSLPNGLVDRSKRADNNTTSSQAPIKQKLKRRNLLRPGCRPSHDIKPLGDPRGPQMGT